jgi:hypothetical protein
MKSFILLALFASIAASSPLPDVPPAIAVEAPETTFVEEAQFATEESFAQAKALVADKGDGACADLADATINEVKQSIEGEQATLNEIDTGAKCSSEGQTAIDAAKASLDSAQEAKTDADKALADAKGAKINFGDFAFDSLTPGNCDSMFSSSAYTSQKAAVDAATEAASQAAGKVTQAQTAVSDAESAAKEAVKTCRCNAYKAHEAALEAANTKAHSANKAAWTKGYHLKCVLAGTAPESCTVPAMPKVQAVQLADGVSEDACGKEGLMSGNIQFPVHVGGNQNKNEPQTSTGGNKGVTVSGNANDGFTFSTNNKNWHGWYRGAYGPWRITEADLPVTLSWTVEDTHGYTRTEDVYWFFGFDHLANNQQDAWYDCVGDFFMRCNNNDMMNEYTHGCQSTASTCSCANGKKWEIKIDKEGTVTYLQNGTPCLTSKKNAKSFLPLVVESSQYGSKTTLSNIKVTHG